MKDNWKEEYLEKLVEELNARIDELEKENEHLRKKDRINQETIKSVRQIEFEYYKALEELKILKEKYKKVILEIRNVKSEYTQKLKEVIKDIKKK